MNSRIKLLIVLLFAAYSGEVLAQAGPVNPTTPGYMIERSNQGYVQQFWQAVTSTNPLPVTTTPSAAPQSVQGAVNVTPTNCSGTITTGGTAQNAVTASTTRRGLQIQNLDTTEGMWISFNGTAAANAAGSFFLSAATSSTSGGSYNTPIGFGFNTALSVVAATTGHKFSCTQW